MTSIRRLVLLLPLLPLLALVACEQPAKPPAPEKPKAFQEQPAKASTEKVQSPSKHIAAKPAPVLSPPEQHQSLQSKPAAAVLVKPRPVAVVREPDPEAPLDLSLNPNVFDPLQPLEPLNDRSTPLLPPLFGDKVAPESAFQLNGKLISNERDDDYWQSVEGAQLQFEFKQ
tara:strand:- start:1070 stop:1582 length:513 start_codon:yes stop_codon:yes gene_type:complete